MTEPTPISRYSNLPPSKLVSSSPQLLDDSVYNKLKVFVVLVLPAIGALYFGLSQIWGFPNPDKIVGTIAVVETFLGAILQYASRSWRLSDDRFVGDIRVQTDADGKLTYSLEVNGDPEELLNQKEVTFKIRP